MMYDRLKAVVDRITALVMVWLMVALVLCVVWQVVSRYLLSTPSTLTDELARYLMMWVGLLGAAWAVGVQRHLAIDLLTQSISPRKRLLLSVVNNAGIGLFAIGVVINGGLRLIFRTLETQQLSAAMQIPMGYIYLILPLSGAVMLFYSFYYCSAALGQLSKTADKG